ncbi:agamous-like MADS-box protein AGL80, partial [Solanum tuberosum]|uniref:agamous-like MADS-box protein AGL80 n=1 Tax=Solanum tuberosum TaxID=4113 RepID=UPI00073A37D2
MPRNKVIFALIENETDRKVSYKKRHKGFLKKAQELMTLCDIEMAAIIYSPYSDEPKVFPNHRAAINTFRKFKELSTLERSKNMVTRDEFTEERIKKLEKKLLKVRKENRVKEITNEMHEVLNGKIISVDMNSYYLNDLSYVIKKNLELVHEAITKNVSDEGSTSNVPQSTPSTTMTYMIPSSIIDPPLYAPVPSPITPQMDPSEEIPPM